MVISLAVTDDQANDNVSPRLTADLQAATQI